MAKKIKKQRISKKKGLVRSLFNKPEQVPADAWGAMNDILHQSLRENIRARRWKIFFRLAYLIVIIAILSIIIDINNVVTDIPFGSDDSYGDISKEHAAVISIHGPVLGSYGPVRPESVVRYDSVADSLRMAFKNDKAKAIFLSVDSPGGDPVTASYIYNEIIKLRRENPDKKVYAVIKDFGASAAYYISAAADEIYCHDFSWVGSIGVILSSFGFDKLIEDYGIERRVYHAGRNKDILDPFAPRNPEHDAHLQELLNSLHDKFIEDVIEGRGDRIAQDDPDVFSGLFFNAEQALELGLVDGVGFFDEIVKDKTGLDNIVDYSWVPSAFNPFELFGFKIGAGFADRLWENFGPIQYRNY